MTIQLKTFSCLRQKLFYNEKFILSKFMNTPQVYGSRQVHMQNICAGDFTKNYALGDSELGVTMHAIDSSVPLIQNSLTSCLTSLRF